MNLPLLDNAAHELPDPTHSAVLGRRPQAPTEAGGEGAALRHAIDTIGCIGELKGAAPQGQGKELDDVIDLLVWQTRVLLMNEAIAGGRMVSQQAREPHQASGDPAPRG